MPTIWPLPQIEITELSQHKETRPTALLTGKTAWEKVGPLVDWPLVVQAEPRRKDFEFLDSLAQNIPPQVEVIYAVGGGLVADIAKYVGWANNIPTVIVPTVLSQDGFFTSLVAVRKEGTVEYIDTGPVERLVVDWDVVQSAPARIRGVGIVELLTIVTGLLDWRYAAERNKNTPLTRYQPWAASVAAGIAQQAFKIAKGVGEGRVESLRNLLDLICMEVQLTNQLGHNRPQEGSEQFFAYAYEDLAVPPTNPIPYADMVGPGILIAAALHGQDIEPIQETLQEAGIRLGQLKPDDVIDTIKSLPEYVEYHGLPYSILNDLDPNDERVIELLETTGLDTTGTRPL